MSPSDWKSQRASKNEARKKISDTMTTRPGNVSFSKHAEQELIKDGLTTADALNVLTSPTAKILNDGEEERGSYRYRLETGNLLIVVAFSEDGLNLTVVTAWDKRKKG